ncbi:MAG: hypothetical protein CVU44_20155 [Chloroflexi bacterium HGW-Chloroflexi-6]|nr:MAG: hypothetical protein CVU44_20155 [Chloroflexi bacterium HGW-Chloroflexi-6]
MKSSLKEDAPAATGASNSETVQNRLVQPNYSTLESAMQYAARGWHVFPCREKPGEPYQDKKGNLVTPREKTPYTANGLYDSSTDPVKIQRWWKKWPDALIGVNCGKSGLFVVDLDTKHGKDGVAVFSRLGLDDEGALHSRTPAGGLHIIFSGVGKNSSGKSGIDTRGEGGYFIAPPSVILDGEFPGGYVNLDDWSRQPAPLPAGLLEAIARENEVAKGKQADHSAPDNHKGKLSRQTLEFIAQGAGAGERNERLFRAACDLAGSGYSHVEAETLLLPVADLIGTPRDEAMSTIKSAFSKSRVPAIAPDNPVGDKANEGSQPALFDTSNLTKSPYRVFSGAFHSVSQDRDGETVRKFLANWHAKIVCEVARDDGQDIARKLVIQGRLSNGRKLPTCEVDAAAFTTMNWVLQHWGTQAIIAAGMGTKDRLREAIQWASQDADSSVVYTHTGWRVLDGKRVYLSNSGALGGEGAKVELDGNLKRYALPVDLGAVNPRDAMQASLDFLKAAPLSATFPIWGSMFLAPLAEITPLDFMMWVFGETGSMKSTLCALALCHYGEFDHKNLPEGWASTDNMLEKQTFIVKDAPLVIDDFAPQASGIDAQAYERRAARLIRSIGNHSPRNRMNADTSTRAGFMARGLVISTGEQLPTGQSVLARILPVEILPRTIDLERLTLAQQTQAGLYPYAMAGYLQWVSHNWQDLKDNYVQWHRVMRDSLRGEFHMRTPEMFAHILMAIRFALTYAVEVQAVTSGEAESLLDQAKVEVVKLAQSQNNHVADEQPAMKFIHAIKALLAKGEFFIEGLHQSPSDNAKWIGWATADFYYLQSEVTFNAVSDFFRKEGSVLGLKQRALNAQLVEKGFIMRGDKNTYAAHHREKGTLRTYAFYRTMFDAE